MKYIPLGTESIDYGWALSSRIWRLSRPAASEETTQYYTAPQTHPDNRYVYLPVNEGDSQPVHTQANADELIEILNTLTEDEKAALQAAITQARGGRVTVIDLFPATVTAQAIDGKEWPKPEVEE